MDDVDRLPPVVRGGVPRARAKARGFLRAFTSRLELGAKVRRTLDVVGVGMAMVIAAPVLVGAAAAIKLTSRGPVFYTQTRVGRHARLFPIYKLRTMYVGADAEKAKLEAEAKGALDGVRFKLKADPRVTPVGRVLRKLSIDELPQLWNVIRGDMTIVGPRPPVPREVNLYEPRALRRLEVTPGLTCLWQVGGRSDLSFAQQVDLDIEYIDRVEHFQEVGIVAKTVPAVLRGRGAY
ncbi:exopolysaccharide biosynthesis polyprenyl glycosylphosphotransferase [soil metagenome]